VPLLAEIASTIAPLLVIAGIGYGWGRSGRAFDTAMIGALVVNFGVPCLIFSTLTRLDISARTFGLVAGLFALGTVINILLAAPALKAMGLDLKVYLPSSVFANSGNMGLPLCLFAFGDDGLVLAIGAFVIVSTGGVTFGIALSSGRFSFGDLLRIPHLWVVAATFAFVLSDVEPPGWLANTTRIVGGMSIPLMLLALGVSISRLKVISLGRSFNLALLRLGLGFLIGWGLAAAFGLEGAARGVLILQFSMPPAVMNYIIAARYERDPGEVAGCIVVGTLLSFVTLPLLLAVVLAG